MPIRTVFIYPVKCNRQSRESHCFNILRKATGNHMNHIVLIFFPHGSSAQVKDEAAGHNRRIADSETDNRL